MDIPSEHLFVKGSIFKEQEQLTTISFEILVEVIDLHGEFSGMFVIGQFFGHSFKSHKSSFSVFGQ